MPIDLTKVIAQPNLTRNKIPANGTYFFKNLTGNGHGNAGVINQNNDTYTKITDQLTNHPDWIYQPQNKHRLELVPNETDRDDVTLIAGKHHGYDLKLKKTHSYSLSVLDVFSKVVINASGVRSMLPEQIKLELDSTPHFLKELDFQPNYQNQLVSLVLPSVDYFEFKDQVAGKEKKAQYVLHYATIYKIEGTDPKSQNIDLILNCDPNRTYFPTSPSKNDCYIVNLTVEHNLNTTNDIKDLSLGDTIKAQVKATENGLFEDLGQLIANFPDASNNAKIDHQIRRDLLANAYHLLKIQDDRRSADDYQKLYDTLSNAFLATHRYSTYEFNKLVNVNTRLSLTRQITLLENDSQVYQFKPTVTNLQTTDKYSPEQLNVIHAVEPYTVVVAGAGSGKSHTLLGRLSYLQQNGVDFRHVLVTSFTNTAAQNIISRFHSGINSLTNANLFHQIYQANFSHTLTNDVTLYNVLDMLPSKSKFMHKTPTINDTRERLVDCLKRSIPTGYEKIDPQNVIDRLVQLFDERLDDIIELLNVVKQTTLLLEPIMISTLMQRQQTITYPSTLNNLDFILTDESQDTSAFEYVLLLQLAHRNHAQLMIIGDANQTLYEFRNANPRFLNTLERSKVFKTYTMSTNYRSKQDILTFANQLLSVMDTNQTAKIQLHANVFSKTDEQTFKDHVILRNLPEMMPVKTFKRYETKDQAALRETLMHNANLMSYVKHCLDQGEQMAILAYRNRDTTAIADAVEYMASQIDPHGNFTVARTRKVQSRPNTWLSNMIANTTSNLTSIANHKSSLTLADLKNDLFTRLKRYTARTMSRRGNQSASLNLPAVNMIRDVLQSKALNHQLLKFNRHQITLRQLIGFIQIALAHAETKFNQTQSLINGSTENTAWKKADLVISTIHSAKGLEFPHVICYFDENHRSSGSQANLRLFGVALTRAEKDELIINNPKRSFNSKAGKSIPTKAGHEPEDLTKTTMRTAYARVFDNFRQTISTTD